VTANRRNRPTQLFLLQLEQFRRFRLDFRHKRRRQRQRSVGSTAGRPRHLAHLLDDRDSVAIGEAAKGHPGQVVLVQQWVEQVHRLLLRRRMLLVEGGDAVESGQMILVVAAVLALRLGLGNNKTTY
jgi:hypothetical protein